MSKTLFTVDGELSSEPGLYVVGQVKLPRSRSLLDLLLGRWPAQQAVPGSGIMHLEGGRVRLVGSVFANAGGSAPVSFGLYPVAVADDDSVRLGTVVTNLEGQVFARPSHGIWSRSKSGAIAKGLYCVGATVGQPAEGRFVVSARVEAA